MKDLPRTAASGLVGGVAGALMGATACTARQPTPNRRIEGTTPPV